MPTRLQESFNSVNTVPTSDNNFLFDEKSIRQGKKETRIKAGRKAKI
jgi:hypothetical protein